MQKDIVYEHDYRGAREIFKSATYTEKQDYAFKVSQETGIYKAISDRIRELPHVLNPAKKEVYDKCLVILEQYAADWGGRIRGVVSYTTYDAHIYLDLPFHEYFDDENLPDLRYICEQARSVCYSVTDENLIRMSISINYFEPVGDVDSIIEEELQKRPSLCNALSAAHESEVDKILSNPVLVAMIEPQAERAGMTVEEYVISLNKFIENHPEEMAEWIEQQLRKKHEELSHEE